MMPILLVGASILQELWVRIMVWYHPCNAPKGAIVSFLSKLTKFDEEPLSLFIFSICHRQEYGNILCSNIIDNPQPSDFNGIHFVHP